MTERITNKIRSLLPGAAVSGKPVSSRGRAVVVTSRPEAAAAPRRAERVTLTFIAPTFAEAKRMYLIVRAAIVSVGNETTVGEGADAIIVRENGGADASYVDGCSLYSLKASFTAIGF